MNGENPKRCHLCGSLNPEVYDVASRQLVCLKCIKEDHPDTELVDPGDVWVIEYSDIENDAGRFPFHFVKREYQKSPGKGIWRVVAAGSRAGVAMELARLVSEWSK